MAMNIQLHTYLKAERGNAARLAKACGVTPGRITQIMQGGNCGFALAYKIERETDGAVDAATLNDVISMTRPIV